MFIKVVSFCYFVGKNYRFVKLIFNVIVNLSSLHIDEH